MSALSYQRHARVGAALQDFFKRMHDPMDVDYTFASFLSELVPEDMHKLVSNPSKYYNAPAVGAASTFVTFRIGDKQYKFTFACSDGVHWLLPQPKHLCWDPEKPGSQRLLKHAEMVAQVRQEFGVAQATIEYLVQNCSSAQQMRFLLPATILLLEYGITDGDQKEHDFVNKLRESRAPNTLPALPMWVREGCRRTGETLAAASMLPASPARHKTFSVATTLQEDFYLQGHPIKPI